MWIALGLIFLVLLLGLILEPVLHAGEKQGFAPEEWRPDRAVPFALNTAAYTTEILRGAIEVTPTGEIEAAKAAGMSPLLMLRRIVLPSAFRRAIPAYANEVIIMLHGSDVDSVVTIIDLTGAARLVQSRYYAPFEAFITAGLFYLTITFGLIWLFRGLEHRLHAHLRRPVA